MDRKLLDYLPPVLREVLEMQAINEANEPEISLAWDAMTLVLANQFLETADARGVAVWEKELGIIPKDTDPLELRKARVMAMWNRETPYTIPWLGRWLDGLYGPGRHREIVEDYTLRLYLNHTGLSNAGDLMLEVARLLMEIQPCNLYLCLEGELRMQGWLRAGGRMAAVTTLPVPEATDRFSFQGAARIGGTMAIITTLPVPERA